MTGKQREKFLVCVRIQRAAKHLTNAGYGGVRFICHGAIYESNETESNEKQKEGN